MRNRGVGTCTLCYDGNYMIKCLPRVMISTLMELSCKSFSYIIILSFFHSKKNVCMTVSIYLI